MKPFYSEGWTSWSPWVSSNKSNSWICGSKTKVNPNLATNADNYWNIQNLIQNQTISSPNETFIYHFHISKINHKLIQNKYLLQIFERFFVIWCKDGKTHRCKIGQLVQCIWNVILGDGFESHNKNKLCDFVLLTCISMHKSHKRILWKKETQLFLPGK